MVISCEEVWRELSNYIDNDIDPALRAEMEAHFAQCKHCTAVLDGTRNVIRLVGDERAFTVPAGFSRRLYQKLSKHNAMSRGPLRGWLVAALGAGIAYAMLTIARAESPALPLLKSEHSQPAARLPVGLVAINEKGKTFHVPHCRFLHGEGKLVSAETAVLNGYTPCVRCEREMLRYKPLVATSEKIHTAQLAKRK